MSRRLADRELGLFWTSLTRFLRSTFRVSLAPLSYLFSDLFRRRRHYRTVLRGAYARSYQLLAPLMTLLFVLSSYFDDMLVFDDSWESQMMQDPLLAEAFLLFAILLLNLLFLLPSALLRWASGRSSAFDLPALFNFLAVCAIFWLLAAFVIVSLLEDAGYETDAYPPEIAIGALIILVLALAQFAFVALRGAEHFRRKSRLAAWAFYPLIVAGFALSVLLIYPWDCPYRVIEWPYGDAFCAALNQVTGWPDAGPVTQQ